MPETGLPHQKSPGRLFAGIVTVSVIVLSFTFTSACVQPLGPEDYYRQGIYYNNHYNQYDKALENFNKSIELEPGNPRVWFARSVALYNLKQYDEALESLNTTIAIDPGYDGAEFMRGEIVSAMAKTNEAHPGPSTSGIVINAARPEGNGSVSKSR